MHWMRAAGRGFLIGAAGPFREAARTIGTGKELVVAGTTTVEAGGTLILAGGSYFSGSTTLLPGATIVQTSSTLRESGAFYAQASSMIRVESGQLDLADFLDGDGFFGDGQIDIQSGASLEIEDANVASLGSQAWVILGGGGASLVALNGLTVLPAATIQGQGETDTPDNGAKPLTNNGSISGLSAAEPNSFALLAIAGLAIARRRRA